MQPVPASGKGNQIGGYPSGFGVCKDTYKVSAGARQQASLTANDINTLLQEVTRKYGANIKGTDIKMSSSSLAIFQSLISRVDVLTLSEEEIIKEFDKYFDIQEMYDGLTRAIWAPDVIQHSLSRMHTQPVLDAQFARQDAAGIRYLEQYLEVQRKRLTENLEVLPTHMIQLRRDILEEFFRLLFDAMSVEKGIRIHKM